MVGGRWAGWVWTGAATRRPARVQVVYVSVIQVESPMTSRSIVIDSVVLLLWLRTAAVDAPQRRGTGSTRL